MTDDWARFVARKEAEALAARLEPWRTDADVHDGGVTPIGNAWSRTLFDGDFFISTDTPSNRPSTNLVFVQSRNGNTVAKDPSVLGGGETDKHVVYEGLSRVAVDAVLAGAETVRGGTIVFSVWHPQLVALRQALGLRRHPTQIVATLGRLNTEGPLFNTPELRVVVLTIRGCRDELRRDLTARSWIQTIFMDRPGDLPWAFAELRRMGIHRVSCVGGRTLAAQLIDHRLVDDIYLTTGAKDGGEPNTPMYEKPIDADLVVRKRGTGADTGITFEHRVIG